MGKLLDHILIPHIHLAKREKLNPILSLLIRLLAFALGMVVCALVASWLIKDLNFNKEGLKKFYVCFIDSIISTDRKILTFVKEVAVLLCIALALAPAFKLQFWNIGAEGQTLVGVLAAYMINFYLGGTFDPKIALNDAFLVPLMLLGAMTVSAIWALIPALFKAKWGTNETLFTLMMNYIATFFVSFCIGYFLTNAKSGKKIKTLDKTGLFPHVFTEMKSIAKPGETYTIQPKVSDGMVAAVIVLLICIVLFIYMRYSKHGYELNVVGQSPRTAQYVGINVKKVIIRTMLLSGLLCGVAGWLIAQLNQSVSEESSVNGQGFTAILVAWLARFNPLFMILTAGVVLFLKKGAGQIMQSFDVTGDLTNVFIGIVLFFIIASEFFVNYTVRIGFHKIEGVVK